MTICAHLVRGRRPCTRPNGHPLPHVAGFTERTKEER